MAQKIPTEEQAQYLILPQMLLLWETHKTNINKYASTLNSTVAELELYETAQHTESVLRFLFRLAYGLKEEAALKAKLTELELD
jgi:hypothetical protein